jgi:hypothetical protein
MSCLMSPFSRKFLPIHNVVSPFRRNSRHFSWSASGNIVRRKCHPLQEDSPHPVGRGRCLLARRSWSTPSVENVAFVSGFLPSCSGRQYQQWTQVEYQGFENRHT